MTKKGTDMRPGAVHIVFKCRAVAARAQCASNSLGGKAMRRGVRRPRSRLPVTRLCVDYQRGTFVSGVYCVWLFRLAIASDCDVINTDELEGSTYLQGIISPCCLSTSISHFKVKMERTFCTYMHNWIVYESRQCELITARCNATWYFVIYIIVSLLRALD